MRKKTVRSSDVKTLWSKKLDVESGTRKRRTQSALSTTGEETVGRKSKRSKVVIEQPRRLGLRKRRTQSDLFITGEETVGRKSKRSRVVIEQPKTEISKECLQPWDFLVKPNEHFPAKIAYRINLDAIRVIKENLNDVQLCMFRETCFGHFLDLPTIVCQPQLVHSLLLREVYCEKVDELWVSVNGKRLKFGLGEFALVTGLKCTGESRKLSWAGDGSRLLKKYFNGSSTVSKQSISDCFMSREWENDEDAVKLAALFFVHLFLLSSKNDKVVDKIDFELVDSGEFNNYPWGKEVFDMTIDSLKGKLVGKERTIKKQKSLMYRLIGFPIAFQIWFYECCPYVNGLYAIHLDQKIPRILHWRASEQPNLKSLKRSLFSLSAEKLMLNNITPNDKEKEQLDLRGLFDESKDKAIGEEMDFGDDDLTIPSSPTTTILSSQQNFAENDIRKELRLVSSRQTEIIKELSSLRMYLEVNIAKAFDAIGEISKKFGCCTTYQEGDASPAAQKEDQQGKDKEDVAVHFGVDEELAVRAGKKECSEADKNDDEVYGEEGQHNSRDRNVVGSSRGSNDGDGAKHSGPKDEKAKSVNVEENVDARPAEEESQKAGDVEDVVLLYIVNEEIPVHSGENDSHKDEEEPNKDDVDTHADQEKHKNDVGGVDGRFNSSGVDVSNSHAGNAGGGSKEFGRKEDYDEDGKSGSAA